MIPTLAGLTVAATAVQIASTVQAAQTQAAMAQHNAEAAQQDAESQAMLATRDAAVLEQQAEVERQSSVLETRLLREEEAFRQGQETADVAASGFEMTGSPLAVATRRARDAELRLELVQFQSAQREAQLTDQAQLERFRAGELRRRGREAFQIGGFRSAAITQAGTTQAVGQGLGGLSQAGRLLTPRT